MNDHVAEPFRSVLNFAAGVQPRTPLPSVDETEQLWHEVARLTRLVEQAARDATSVGRCQQLHERIYACLQTLNSADKVVKQCWDDRLRKGYDV